MLVRAAFAAVVVVAVVASTTSACGYYQASDKPICGDRVIPDGDTCAVWPAPCGCPDNQKCGLASVTSTGVFTFACATPGPKGIDAPCTDDTECAKGTICDGTRCRQTCFEALDCGNDAAVSCRDDYRDANDKRVAGSCTRDCDPVNPQSPSDGRLETCRADEACYASINLVGGTVSACTRSAGTHAAKMTCASDADCVIGTSCVTIGSATTAVCARLCWMDDGSTCTGTMSCSALSSNGTALAVLGRALGICQ